MAADARRSLLLFWHRSHRGVWIAALAAVAVAGLFAGLLGSVYSGREDQRAITCLALNVYFEARGESTAGQYAVAEVTMNRVESGRYPDNVCGVVYQKNWDPLRGRYVGAFSWTEFARKSTPRGPEWEKAWRVADAVYYRRSEPSLDGALLYHSVNVKPSWARGQKPVARIGRHLFYR
jgi:spore germination cell wall hydrolase CwlJ-like protein